MNGKRLPDGVYISLTSGFVRVGQAAVAKHQPAVDLEQPVELEEDDEQQLLSDEEGEEEEYSQDPSQLPKKASGDAAAHQR